MLLQQSSLPATVKGQALLVEACKPDQADHQLHACAGSVSNVVAGLDWVASNAQLPAIVTLSLGISKGSASQSLEQAVTSLVQDFNVTVIAASGELPCCARPVTLSITSAIQPLFLLL